MNDRSPSPSAADGMTLIEHLPFDIDEGIASRARIGLMVLATDFTIEHEWRAIMTGLKGVALYESRILNDAQITPETLRAMEPRIAAATGEAPGTIGRIMSASACPSGKAIDRLFALLGGGVG